MFLLLFGQPPGQRAGWPKNEERRGNRVIRRREQPTMKDFLHDRPGLYCIELRTANWQASVEWYRQVLGLRVLVRVVDEG
jgi:hypothetical protein